MFYKALSRIFQLITLLTVMYGSLVIYVTSTPVLDLNKPLSVYSSRVSKNKLLAEYIATANHSLECFIYNLTDQTIIDLLNEKALEGVSIDISTDKKNKTIILIIFSNEQGENHFRFSPVQILLKNIKLKTKLEPNSYSKV